MDGFTQALGLGYRRDAVGRVVVEDGLVRMQPYGGGLHIDALKSASAALENAQAQLLGILGYSVGEVSPSLARSLSRALALSRARSLSIVPCLPLSFSLSVCLSHSFSRSLSLSLFLPVSLFRAHSLLFSLSLSLPLYLSVSRSLFLPRSAMHTHTLKRK